jgi:hypothetical protein
MLIDMMKDIERKAGVAAPPEPHRFAPADEEVIRGVVARIRGTCCKKSRRSTRGTRLSR